MRQIKISYALCNQNMKPVMHFSDKDQLDNWVQKQIEQHGAAPNCVPCEIITIIETRAIK